MSDTKTLDSDVKTPQPDVNEPSREYIDGGINAAENYANTPGQGDTPITDNSQPKDSNPGEGGAKTSGGGKQPQSSQSSATGKQKWRDRAKQWNENRKAGGGLKGAAKDKMKQAGKAVAKKVAKQAVKRGADAVAPGSGEVAGEVAERGGKAALAGAKMLRGNINQGMQDLKEQVSLKGLKKTLEGPVKMILIAVVAAFFIIVIIIFMVMAPFMRHAGEEEIKRLAAIQGIPLTVSKTAPTSVSNGQEITYTITVNTQQLSDVIINEEIPNGTQFVKTNTKLKCDPAPCSASSKKITWDSKDNGLTPPINTSFTLTVKPTVTNAYVVNIATGILSTPAQSVSCQPSDPGYVCAYKNIVNHNVPSGFNYWAWSPPGHMGVDLITRAETPIRALEDGVVVQAYYDNGGGNMYKIHDNNKRFHMGLHMIRPASVKIGQIVKKGDIVGYVGHTGNNTSPTDHLHYQISTPSNDQYNAWANPAVILKNWPSY